MVKYFRYLILLPAFFVCVSCNAQPTEVLVAGEKFTINKNENILYDKDHETIKFALRADDKNLITSESRTVKLSNIVDIKVSDIKSEVYGHKGIWDKLPTIPLSSCKEQSYKENEYILCERNGSAKLPKEIQLSKKGEKPYLVVSCDTNLNLPNPLCVANGHVFGSVGTHYTFNVQYLQDVIMINETINEIVTGLSTQSKEDKNDLHPDATSKGHS